MARRPDLTESMIAEIITLGDHWLVHSFDLDADLPDRFRRRLAAHRDTAVRSALVIHAATAPREMPEQLIDDPDPPGPGEPAPGQAHTLRPTGRLVTFPVAPRALGATGACLAPAGSRFTRWRFTRLVAPSP